LEVLGLDEDDSTAMFELFPESVVKCLVRQNNDYPRIFDVELTD
jgi:hypothetical protein